MLKVVDSSTKAQKCFVSTFCLVAWNSWTCMRLDFVPQGFAVDDLRYALEQLRYVKYGKASAL